MRKEKDAQLAPDVAQTLEEVVWFESVLASAKEDLRKTPDEYRPTWYKRHEAGTLSSRK